MREVEQCKIEYSPMNKYMPLDMQILLMQTFTMYKLTHKLVAYLRACIYGILFLVHERNRIQEIRNIYSIDNTYICILVLIQNTFQIKENICAMNFLQISTPHEIQFLIQVTVIS